MAARAFAFGTSLVGMGVLLPTTRTSCGGFSWRVLRRRGVDVGVAVAVGACVAEGSMEVGLLLLAEPSGGTPTTPEANRANRSQEEESP